MAAQNTDLLTKLGLPGSATTLASPGHTIGGTSITVDSTSLWPTDTGVIFGMDTVTLVNGEEVRDVNSYTVWEGVVTSATGIGSMVLKHGTDQNYPAGSTTRVYILPSVIRENQVVDWGLEEHDQDGTHSDITATSVTATTGTFTNLTVSGTATSQGWTALGDVPDTVTANGNRNYDIVFNGVDHTSTLSPGMKLQLTRTVAAPSQCTSLNGTTQYFSKTTPSGTIGTATDDLTFSGWVRPTSYTSGVFVSKATTTNGFSFAMNADGRVYAVGINGGAGNYRQVISYASLPLNKWTHVSMSLDMSGWTTATNKIAFDGVDVAAQLISAGTNPTAFVQAGNLEIGADSAASFFFTGKLAQIAVYNGNASTITQATIKNSMDRTLTGSETNAIGVWTLNGASGINDLTANANNLTAQGSAVATNADSPFANAVAAGTLEYAEVNSVTFSTNTTVNLRVPDTCQIPTSGGVSAVSYSTQSNPYGLPYFSKVLGEVFVMSDQSVGTVTDQAFLGASLTVYIPSNTRAEVELFIPQAYNTSAGVSEAIYIYTGSVSSGTRTALGTWTSAGASYQLPSIVKYRTSPTAGTQTYLAGITSGAGTFHTAGSVSTPLMFRVVLV